VELDGRDGDREEDEETGRCGNGDVAVAKSSVATSSVLLGVPHAEQKRPFAGTSVPQDEQAGMSFSRIQFTASNEE
jgi:hypothetical protein